MSERWEYPERLRDEPSPFNEELRRLTELHERAESLGLSDDDQATIHEAIIALRVLIDQSKRGRYDSQIIERARREAAKLRADDAGERVLEILRISKSTTARNRMVLGWWAELTGPASSRVVRVHDYLNLYPKHHEAQFPDFWFVYFGDGLSHQAILDRMAEVTGKSTRDAVRETLRAAIQKAKKEGHDLGEVRPPGGWTAG